MEFLADLSPLAQAGIAVGTVAFGSAIRFIIKSGIFIKPDCSIKRSPEMRVAYKIYHGAYSESGAKFGDVFALVEKAGGDVKSKNQSVGVFFDDPGQCPVEYLRYAAGCQIQDDQPELEKLLKENGYSFTKFPACKCAFTSFPFYSSLSVMLAVGKVYGPIYEYAKSQFKGMKPPELICFELYPEGVMEYYVPVDRKLKNFDVFFLGQEQDMQKYGREMTEKANKKKGN